MNVAAGRSRRVPAGLGSRPWRVGAGVWWSCWRFDAIIKLTNHSASDCTLSGWADFSMVGVAQNCGGPFGGPTCPPPDLTPRTDQKISRVDLAPQKVYLVHPTEYVAFSALWNPTMDPDCPGPWFRDPYEVDIRVPGDQTPIPLRPVPVQPCNGDVGITALGVLA